jgi:phosphopentomutase
VFQIAAHTDIVPLALLYEWCEKARAILTGEHSVARVIARPFAGKAGSFARTVDRRDYSLKPDERNLLASANRAGYTVTGIGKIEDLYAGSGLTRSFHTHTNAEGIEKLIEIITEQSEGLVVVNLVDFDMLYGHRNDCPGLACALEYFDMRLPEILTALHSDDLIALTADHGNDPTTPSTDHSRENVPLLVYGENIRAIELGVRDSLADLGATCAEFLKITPTPFGTSFLGLISPL